MACDFKPSKSRESFCLVQEFGVLACSGLDARSRVVKQVGKAVAN